MVYQEIVRLQPFRRGFHLITGQVESVIGRSEIQNGICNVFIKHTSASLTINENADPTVRDDFERFFNHMVPEDTPYFEHTYEGSDDMPAHIKSSLMGASLNIPITGGRLNMGTWQGIYLCEHRNHGGQRSIVVTLYG